MNFINEHLNTIAVMFFFVTYWLLVAPQWFFDALRFWVTSPMEILISGGCWMFLSGFLLGAFWLVRHLC